MLETENCISFDIIIPFILSISHLLSAYHNKYKINLNSLKKKNSLSLKLSYFSALILTTQPWSLHLLFYCYYPKLDFSFFTLIGMFGFHVLFLCHCLLNPATNLKRKEKKESVIIKMRKSQRSKNNSFINWHIKYCHQMTRYFGFCMKNINLL